jgi:hypothetical protein
MIINSQIPTKIELNGPILSFDTGIAYHPTPATGSSGESVTFTGLATATFPTQTPSNPAENSGYISYRWYEVGIGALSNGGQISGAETRTLTVSSLRTPQDHNRQFYLRADYVPSAYAQPVGAAVTVGTARSTGNALNDGLDSNIVTLIVNPLLQVVTNPTGQIVSQTKTACFTAEGSLTDSTQGDLSYQWQLNGQDLPNGSNNIGDVTGATSKQVCITSSVIGEYLVRAKLTHPTASNSPIYTESARYQVVSARQIINAEFINQNAAVLSGTASYNLFTTPSVTFDGSNVTGLICLYAAERDVSVIMDCYAAKGQDNNGYSGGQGGVSTVKFTMRAGEEYVINNIPQANNSGAIFIYRQERLIITVSAGGNAGSGGAGGAGGGVNVAGAPGEGRGAGAGGSLYQAGTLAFPGIFGSAATGITPVADDGFAPDPLGGRIIPCPRGDYWRSRGFSPCQRLGNVPFYNAGGSVVPGTSSTIERGFKAGYGIRNTAGRGINGGGTGGNGATGGNGGNGGGGGGGGSGYTDGSVTILSTQLGGNNGQPRVVLRLGDLL